MKRSVDLIMFDLDGTLADTGPDLADSVNYTRSRFELSPLPQQLIYTHVGRGVEYLLRHAVAKEAPFQFSEIMRVFLEHYQQHLLDRTVLYPHVHEVLNYFHGKRNAVVTNKLHHLAVTVLRGLGIENRFDAVLGGDSGAEKKPDPALLRGDGDTDIQAGKWAGVITCGVTYGLANKGDLIAAKPDFLIDDLAQLAQYFS
jgi:phosphoglycolate phosphatase-like HAD superfamily hydrolase